MQLRLNHGQRRLKKKNQLNSNTKTAKNSPKTKPFRSMRNRPNHGLHRCSEKKESTKLKSGEKIAKRKKNENNQRRESTARRTTI
jgi:hypothetical protein